MIERSVLRVKTLRTMGAELLNLTAIQTGNFTLHRAPVEPGPLVAAVVEALRERAAERGITLAVEGAAAGVVPAVLADREALAMIVSNLVENAVKYGRDGGRAEVRLAHDGPYVSVSVRDDGIGISPEDQARVFDEFYRARTEQTASITGTGLGLSLVKRLAEMHEGTVRLESSPGEGSTFTVSIPAAVP
jgi:two-component system phosphate regulon sensor histidine kinase PhoR